jgi:hypothetical protein
MNFLTADKELLERLAGVMEPAEIRDASGKVLGRFTPEFADENDRRQRAAKYFDLAEAEGIAATDDGKGSALVEVWERIRAGETHG